MVERASGTKAARLGARIGLACIALALPLIALEVVGSLAGGGDSERWRTRGLHRPDSDLIYSLRPSSNGEWSTAEFVERAHTNAAGLRGPELSPDALGRPRVVILGDSMTYGHGVGDDKAYPAQLAALLADQQPEARVEVVNAGVKGYGTDHAYKLFTTRLRSLRPRVVVFALNYNDYEDNIRYPLFRLEAGRLVALDARDDPLYRVALLSERLPDWLAERHVTRAVLRALTGWSTARSAEERVDEADRIATEQRKISLQLRHLARLGREDGFTLLVLALPFRDGEWDPFAWLTPVHRGGAPFLDLSRDPSWQSQKERWFFRTDEHLSPAGHRRVAEQLHAFIQQDQALDER